MITRNLQQFMVKRANDESYWMTLLKGMGKGGLIGGGAGGLLGGTVGGFGGNAMSNLIDDMLRNEYNPMPDEYIDRIHSFSQPRMIGAGVGYGGGLGALLGGVTGVGVGGIGSVLSRYLQGDDKKDDSDDKKDDSDDKKDDKD